MIPEKVKIGWKTYEIQKKEAVVSDGRECYGAIDFDKQIIEMRQNNSKEQEEATLIHEVLHGVSDMSHLDFSEDTVTRLAEALYTVATDNGIDLFN